MEAHVGSTVEQVPLGQVSLQVRELRFSPANKSFHQCLAFIHLSSGASTIGPLAAAISRDSLPPHTKNKEL